jgi:hypothetical protein
MSDRTTRTRTHVHSHPAHLLPSVDSAPSWHSATRTLATAVSLTALSIGTALAGSDDAATRTRPEKDAPNAAVMKKFEAMEARIKTLEGKLKEKEAKEKDPVAAAAAARPYYQRPATASFAAAGVALPPGKGSKDKDKKKDLFGVAESPMEGLKIGMYGEIKFGSMQNPNAGGQWQNGFDMARLVLLPTYQVSSNIIFNAEIEFEHAGAGFDNDDKLHGTAEVEQAFFDFKINDYFNFRAPGVDIVPISFNNLYHEPTLFYSVQRPELANGLIPTTWVAPSTGFYGKIIDGLNYQFQLSQSTWRISATILRIAAPTGPQSPGATRRGSMA